MKKTFKSVAIVLAMLMAMSLMFVGCNKDKKDDTKNNEKMKFIVGLDASFPPYGYKDKKGNIVGFDIDLAKEVAKRNNWEFSAQPIDWDAKDTELNSGTITCIWNGFTINGREDDYSWSKPYVDNSQVVVVKKDSNIKNLKNLKDKIVCVQTDSSAEHVLKKNKKMIELAKTFKKLDIVPEYNTAFLNLEAGAVDAVGMDVGVAKYQIEKRGDQFIILDDVLATEKYGVGFKKGDTKIKDKVDKTLDEMRKDGTFMKIAKKWKLQDSVIVD